MESTPLNANEVKKPLEVWQGIVGIFVVLSIVVGLYASSVSEAKASATVQENHERRLSTLESNYTEIRADQKETKQMVTEIRLILKDKQDRK